MKEESGIFENMISAMAEEELQNKVHSQGERQKNGVSPEKNYKLPQRIQILLSGFENKWSAAQVNQRLEENFCERLYARNIYEAGLIYAFTNGLSLEEWAKLYEKYGKRSREAFEKVQTAGIWHGKVTLNDLEEYVFSNTEEGLRTAALTKKLEQSLNEKNTDEEFMEFMWENRDKFSAVREKARYYFCKYLYFYVRERCEAYYRSCEETERERQRYGRTLPKDKRGEKEKLALEELRILKSLTVLKEDVKRLHTQIPLAEKKNYLRNTAISPGGVFDEFNYYYFGYVSIDWVEILFEFYGFFEDWPEEERVRIAHSLGYCRAEPDEKEKQRAFEKLSRLSDDEKERERQLDREYEREDGEEIKRRRKRLYQKGRSGEKYFREIIRGERDINRDLLISFLLFVKMRTKLDEENRLTIPRLNRILDNCGFPQLRPDREFDVFVREFLRMRNPSELLEKKVEEQVVRGKNFYLYKIYRDAYSHQEELVRHILRCGEEVLEDSTPDISEKE